MTAVQAHQLQARHRHTRHHFAAFDRLCEHTYAENTCAPRLRWVCAPLPVAGDEFQRSNIRAFPEAEPLGCLGDQGWYCACAAIWAYNCELPEMVVAHPGRDPALWSTAKHSL